MSRSQQGQVLQQAQGENATYNTDAQTAFKGAEGDIGSYQNQLASFTAANPYTAGGAYQTAQNQQLSDTAAGDAISAGNAIQSAAVRTGQNPGGAIAATEQMEENNERNLAGQEASATTSRIAADTGYNQTALDANAKGEAMQDSLATQQAQAAQGALGTQEQAAQTPSFTDELGNGLIQAGVGFASNAAKLIPGLGGGSCWIAAELWGGWEDPRVILVRTWLMEDFGQSWYGALVLRAYSRWGMEVAAAIRTRPRLRWCFEKLFNQALRSAKSWEQRCLLDPATATGKRVGVNYGR